MTVQPVLSGDSTVTPYVNMGIYNKDHFGFIAQDFQQIFPELVQTDKDGYLCIDYIAFIPVLTEAIKEQQATIETLQEEIDQLKATINSGN